MDVGEEHKDKCSSNGENRGPMQQWRIGFGCCNVQ